MSRFPALPSVLPPFPFASELPVLQTFLVKRKDSFNIPSILMQSGTVDIVIEYMTLCYLPNFMILKVCLFLVFEQL